MTLRKAAEDTVLEDSMRDVPKLSAVRVFASTVGRKKRNIVITIAVHFINLLSFNTSVGIDLISESEDDSIQLDGFIAQYPTVLLALWKS